MLFDVRPAVFVAGNPRVLIHDGVEPRPERDAAMRQEVIFLNRAVQLADRHREPAWREAREVVAEQIRAQARAREDGKAKEHPENASHGDIHYSHSTGTGHGTAVP